MKRLAKRLLATYLVASALISAAYNLSPYWAWDIAEHRYGLLCVGVDPWCNDYWVLSPFCNHADVFLFGIQQDGEGWWTYSDGFGCFGEW